MQLSSLPNIVRQLVHEEKEWGPGHDMINDCMDPYRILTPHHLFGANGAVVLGALLSIGRG